MNEKQEFKVTKAYTIYSHVSGNNILMKKRTQFLWKLQII